MTTLVINGPIVRADIGELCERARDQIESAADRLVVCNVGALKADAVAVDALARIYVSARRCGAQFQLLDASVALTELVAFVGLQEVLLKRLPLELQTEAEQRKQPSGVEEETDAADPPI